MKSDFNTSQPLRNLARLSEVDAVTDDRTRNFLRELNGQHLEQYPGDSQLAARIASYELAARMQVTVPDVCDLASESFQL